MTRWDDQFERHAIFAALDDARKRLELAEQEVGEDVALREAQARIGHVLDHLEATLKEVDPELVASNTLDQIAGNLGQVSTYLQNFGKAPLGGEKTGPSPTDRAKKGRNDRSSPRATASRSGSRRLAPI